MWCSYTSKNNHADTQNNATPFVYFKANMSLNVTITNIFCLSCFEGEGERTKSKKPQTRRVTTEYLQLTSWERANGKSPQLTNVISLWWQDRVSTMKDALVWGERTTLTFPLWRLIMSFFANEGTWNKREEKKKHLYSQTEFSSSWQISVQQNDKQITSHSVNHLGSDHLKVSIGVGFFVRCQITSHWFTCYILYSTRNCACGAK